MRRRLASSLLLATCLLPLGAQAGALIHLLDAGRVAHPASLVELLVHGHPHGERAPRHSHSVREGPAAPSAERPPAAIPLAGAPSERLDLRVDLRPVASVTVARASSSAPLRFLLLGVLLR